MHDNITFQSDGLALAGVFHAPDNGAGGEKPPALVIMRGFGGHKDGPGQRWPTSQFPEWGYACLNFDFRGCGAAEGPRGMVVPGEEINDCKAAIDYLASRPEVDPDRIALLGTSSGAIVGRCKEAWHRCTVLDIRQNDIRDILTWEFTDKRSQRLNLLISEIDYVPEVCSGLGIPSLDAFQFNSELDFRTNWQGFI